MRAIKVGGATLTCSSLALAIIVVLATVVPILFAFTVGGGPLAPLWNQVNPFSPVGIELRFCAEGIGAGQLDDPRAIAADSEGNIYVADYTSGRLQSFDALGKFRWLANLGEESYVQALEQARDGALLVVTRGALRRFNPADGAELPALPISDEYYFEDVSVAPDGRIAAIVDSEDILLLDPSYRLLLFVPEAIETASGDSELEADIDIDGLGNLYVLGTFNDSVFTFTSDGRFTNRIGSSGDARGQLSAAGDLAVDGQGRIYVSDFNGVQVFAADGRFLDRFDLGGYVFGLNFDLQNKLYTISNDPEVMRLSVEKCDCFKTGKNGV
jgi:DNA-binding beta-propeller fold protein YncE